MQVQNNAVMRDKIVVDLPDMYWRKIYIYSSLRHIHIHKHIHKNRNPQIPFFQKLHKGKKRKRRK